MANGPVIGGLPGGGLTQEQLTRMLLDAPTQGALNARQQLAQGLLQAGNRTTNPLLAGLTGFLGANEMQSLAGEQEKIDRANIARQLEKERRIEEREARRFDLQERQFAASQEQFRTQMAENARQFSEKMRLNRDKFNAEEIRDKNNNAVTRVKDEKRDVDLLFKGNEPINDGLEKGMQWAIDKEGNRIAVPVNVMVNEKGAAQKRIGLQTVRRLLKNKDGVFSNFGPVDQITPNLLSSTRNALTDINQLRAILTVENLGLMSGVLSETDIKILQNVSAGGIADTASDEGAFKELQRMELMFDDRSFPTVESAEEANLPKGTKVLIDGRFAVVE